jgi:O-methyltransferase
VIRTHTVVDLHRRYELWTLASRLAHLRGDVIEIGVWRGGTGALIAHKVQTVAPDRVVYLCDTFTLSAPVLAILITRVANLPTPRLK